VKRYVVRSDGDITTYLQLFMGMLVSTTLPQSATRFPTRAKAAAFLRQMGRGWSVVEVSS
jgi:hypothetical protein